MIQSIRNYLLSLYKRIISSIAFYPALILIAYFILAAILLTIEESVISQWLIDNTPFLVMDNADTARSILTTIIGGSISLMVFSFTMVMMILNQAGSSFSPRLIPGLISDKRNQVVLGIYLGTIVFNILVLMGIRPEENEYTLNVLAILIGVISSITCLVLFIYFIHTISNSLQINNILVRIFDDCKNGMTYLLNSEQVESAEHSIEHSFVIKSEKSGYFQDVNIPGLLKKANSNQVNIRILPLKGDYLLAGVDALSIDRSIDEDLAEDLLSYIIYSTSKDVRDNYFLGFKQIMEVGLKAMSPGINDPGTAIITLDRLTELFALRMRLGDRLVHQPKGIVYVVEEQTITFHDLLYKVYASYRQYCKHDYNLMEKLINLLKYLHHQEAHHQHYYQSIQQQLNILKAECEDNIDNRSDRTKLIELIDSISLNS